MTRPDDEADVIGTKPVRDQTEGLPMFAPAVPVVVLLGAGQHARAKARERTNVRDAYAKILAALDAAPKGLTRSELHRVTGLPINTCNGRVAELRDAARWVDGAQVFTEGLRETWDEKEGRTLKESVVHRRRNVAGVA